MVMLMDYPASVELLSAAGQMNISDSAKFSILGISVCLLLVALGILAWQTFRCCTQFNYTHVVQDRVRSGLLYCDRLLTPRKCSGAPDIKTADVRMEVHKLGRCLSADGSSLFSGSRQAVGDLGEHADLQTHQVRGSLRFSMYYDQLQSRLVVTVLQATGLPEGRHARTLVPFVMLRLMWAGSEGVEGGKDGGTPQYMYTVLQEWRTRVVKGSSNPLFGDEFSCILQEKDLRHITLRMEVRDFDKFSRHKALGEVRVPVVRLKIYPVELQQDLQIPQRDLVGVVLLSLKFLPTSQRLEVGLLKVKMLPTEIKSDAALYARINVQCNQCKLQQKVPSVNRRHVTIFNQVLIFSLPEFPLEQCKILVSLFETEISRRSSKHLIGQLTVGKERTIEDKHWSLMMQSVRQPIAKWHGLFI
ncbi:synaptotagmin-2 isoform X2 [Genypterus blacodes]|uniref:synaptotagmin-2 isoform X2 n=1 Tax=Genypterus blacodes TaxID=154954 RepID=UPI003F75D5B1